MNDNLPEGKTYIGSVILFIINLLVLFISYLILDWGLRELRYEGERWGLIGVAIIGSFILLVQICILLPCMILSLIRKKSPLGLRFFICLSFVIGFTVNIFALRNVWFSSWQHKQQFMNNSNFNMEGLFQAIQANDRNVVTTIIQNNRNIVYERDYYGDTPLIFSVKQKKPDMIKLLLSCGAEINGTDTSGNSPLHWAVDIGSVEMIELLIKQGSAINQGDNWGKTPLALAKEKGDKKIIEVLEKHGATPMDYQKSIIDAVEQGNYKTVKQLLSEGVDVNTRVPNGCSIIHFAAENGYLDIVTLLLEKGANVNDIAPSSRLTPLHLAARDGYLEVVKFLIAKGANPELKNYQNETPADLARREGYKETADYLDQYITQTRQEIP